KASMWSLAFSPDSRWLLSASEDQTVGVSDVATGELVARLVGHGAPVLCAAMSPDGTRIASGGRDRIVRLWDTTHFDCVPQAGGQCDYILSRGWRPAGRRLFSAWGATRVRTWDTRSLSERRARGREGREALPRREAGAARARVDAQVSQAAAAAV